MIAGRNLINHPVKNNLRICDNVIKIVTGQEDDYTTCCLIHYFYFKHCYRMIAIDLSKQQALQVDPKAIQQTNFTGNLDRAGNTTVFFIIEDANKTI